MFKMAACIVFIDLKEIKNFPDIHVNPYSIS